MCVCVSIYIYIYIFMLQRLMFSSLTLCLTAWRIFKEARSIIACCPLLRQQISQRYIHVPQLKERFKLEEGGAVMRNGSETVVATVGVGEFRSSVPYVVKVDDVVLEIGCQQGHTCRVVADHLKKLEKERGADAMVTPCPLCHLNLDGYQPNAASSRKREIDLPIIHLPQLVGLALGIDPKEMRLNKHIVSTKKLLSEIAVSP